MVYCTSTKLLITCTICNIPSPFNPPFFYCLYINASSYICSLLEYTLLIYIKNRQISRRMYIHIRSHARYILIISACTKIILIHNVFILTRNVSGKFRLHDYLICKEPSGIVNIIKLDKYKNPLKETHNFTEKFLFIVIDSNIHWNFDAAYH